MVASGGWRPWSRWWLGATLILIGVGCQSKSPPPTEATSEGAAATEATPTTTPDSADGATRGLKIRPNVTSFPGRWGLVITQPMMDQNQEPLFRDLCLAILEFNAGEGGALTAQVLAKMEQAPEAKVSELKAEGAKLSFQMSWADAPGDFQGTLADGVIRGSLSLPGAGVVLAMLRPTEETSFEGWDPTPPSAGLALFTAAVKDKNQPQAMLAVAKELRGSPLSMQAYDGMVQRLAAFGGFDDAKLREFRDDYLAAAAPWGDRIVEQSKLNVALGVVSTRKHPEFALELINAAAQTEPLKTQAAETIKLVTDQANVDIALRDIKSEQADVAAGGYATLKDLLAAQRYNAEILEALGTHAQKTGDTAAAKEYFADILALPLLEQFLLQSRSGQPPGDPGPRDQLLTLWETEHGSVEGFDEFLAETYRRRIEELSASTREAATAVVPEAERQRTILVELHTGTGCPPCVAGDLGASFLRQTYPSDSVVVVQFHQHIPMPDPLVNQDSEDRFGYYEAGGTPAAFVDGFATPAPGVGGFLQSTQQAYRVLRAGVDARLKQPAGCTLELTAAVTDGELSVTAVVPTLPEGMADSLRLRLALVENEIAYAAPNGIREHHYVVREMLGGAKGTAVRDGKLEYTLQMPLAEVQSHLDDYLAQFEAGRNLTFPEKPTTLKSLSLVGWVQNDLTREVLETKLIPVAGTEQPATTEPAPAAAETPAPQSPAP
jgi:hypothetical protein